MVKNKKKTQKKDRPPHTTGYTVIFARIVSHPDILDGRPHIRSKKILLDDILAKFNQGATDGQIFKAYPNLSQMDVKSCRAWQARFQPEMLSSIFNRHSKRMVFMMDENQPYSILPDVVRIFGRSSHVMAEHLYDMRTRTEKKLNIAPEKNRNDDEKDIWAHIVKHGYAGILTRDWDFFAIAKRNRQALIEKYGSVDSAPVKLPAVIIVGALLSTQQTVDVLEKHAEAIRRFLKDNDAACLKITTNAAEKVLLDDQVIVDIMAYRQRNNLPPLPIPNPPAPQ